MSSKKDFPKDVESRVCVFHCAVSLMTLYMLVMWSCIRRAGFRASKTGLTPAFSSVYADRFESDLLYAGVYVKYTKAG